MRMVLPGSLFRPNVSSVYKPYGIRRSRPNKLDDSEAKSWVREMSKATKAMVLLVKQTTAIHDGIELEGALDTSFDAARDFGVVFYTKLGPIAVANLPLLDFYEAFKFRNVMVVACEPAEDEIIVHEFSVHGNGIMSNYIQKEVRHGIETISLPAIPSEM